MIYSVEDAEVVQGPIGTVEVDGTIYAVIRPNHRLDDDTYLKEIADVDEMEVEKQ